MAAPNTIANDAFLHGVGMRAVLQRVRRARVTVEDEITGEITRGWLLLLGIAPGDTEKDVDWLAEKIANLRAFEDEAGKMNLSVQDVSGAILVVSQFTLYGDCLKGRRPGFTGAAPPAVAEPLYESFVIALKALGIPVATGRFGADMQVELVNEGPVTFVIDTPHT
jgi:D-tyrosyl-tRNA(Tyr) deacylase